MNCQILILYFSRHGSTKQLARQIARGVESTPHCEAILRTVEELSPHSQPPSDPIVTLDELKTCDGLAFGSPVWFGNMAAPLKHFWDQTTPLWVSGDLIDKPACVFTSSSSMHGGQESTLQSMMIPLLHHGMMVLGIPYSQPELHSTASGGTPYGASSVGQDPSLTTEEIRLAQQLGKRLATTAQKLKGPR
ncbi:NAD(P)H:quinone oxidoreductase [Vibrio alfacsensis]|uniref:NAD(P)H:quinone oxidoreductase n=1 Tax=Vibrio alfacsensis TaxID=1074311 RepID=UPI0040680C5C